MSDALVEKTVPLLLRGGEPVEVRIFQCSRKWADLTVTPDEGVRHCDSCNRRVHQISDERASNGPLPKHCVSVLLADLGTW